MATTNPDLEDTEDEDKPAAVDAPLADIDLSPQRPTVRLKLPGEDDFKLFEIRLLREFGIRDQQRLQRDGSEFAGLFNSEVELTDEQGERLELLLDRMFSKVIDAPREVKTKLDDLAKSEVVEAFTYAPLMRQARIRALKEWEARQVDKLKESQPGGTT